MLKDSIKSQLTAAERQQIRTLVLRDAIALLSILGITVLLAIATHYLFKSYSDHREELANRWFTRGNAAMQARQPSLAIDDFHSALLYAPGQRQMEIALASALASAGKVQEATAYFNTLREAEPGNGEINLQLARLAARSGNDDLAKREFHAAIYGNWEGDGYPRRRATRLELVRFLIARGYNDQARSELLVASGNAPSSDLEVQSQIAGLLVEDHYPLDALNLSRQLLSQHPEYLDALEGAAATSYTAGNYAAAFRYLERAVASPGYANKDALLRQLDTDQLHRLGRILVLDPSKELSATTVATRLLNNREIAHKRLQACLGSLQGANLAGPSTGAPSAPDLQAASREWDAEPVRLDVSALIDDPSAEERERKLINNIETSTAQACGNPAGDDAILLRLAEVPDLNDVGAGQSHE